jgi:hypothetical protein
MVNAKQIREALVYYENGNESRWIDAKGNNVTKFMLDKGTPCDDTTGKPQRFTITVTETGAGSCTIVNTDTAGVALKLTTDDAEYEGINMQANGEPFKLTTALPFYFGIKCSISNATETDMLVGLCLTQTDLMKTAVAHGVKATGVEGVFFVKVDGATTISAKTYLAGTQTATADYASAMDTSAHIYELLWDAGYINFYIDGNLVTKVAASLPTEDLTPSINFRAGSGAARTMSIYWMKAIQIN